MNVETDWPVAGTKRGAVVAPVLEVFPSIQGEGLYAGEPQTFVRLRGCPLRCRYCDTPGSWPLAGKTARVVLADGSPRREPSEATPFQVLCWAAEAEGGEPRTLSLTGGEPLLWPEFVLALAALRGERRLHLETAGAHADALARVVDHVQHVSLDLKLASTLDPPVDLAHGGPVPRTAEDWRLVRRRTLGLVRGRDACGKVVLVESTPLAELTALLDDVAVLAPELPVVLQPATAMGGERPPTGDELERAVGLALERELTVRVLPQVHRMLGVS